MDKTSFWWTGLCGICHTGGGPTEFDRDGHKYYDVTTGKFGYEMLGRSMADIDGTNNNIDGDYTEVSNKSGALRVAPWDKTGVAEPDCLYCHRTDRTMNPDNGMPMNWVWRAATLRKKDTLVNTDGDPVMAFAAAATAAQGWISTFKLADTPAGKPPMATEVTIDYTVGVNNGSLTQKGNTLYVPAQAIADKPKDMACWGCHNMADSKKRGREWFDPTRDVHYAAFNNLDDADNTNDIGTLESTACLKCHPAEFDGMKYNHNLAKGNANLGSARNDTDYMGGFRSCRECHLGNSAVRDADAPIPPDNIFHDARHTNVFSCEACHIPSKNKPAQLVADNSITGSPKGYNTNVYLSADPLDPENEDRSKWYPSFTWKKDHDGVLRVFPAKLLLSAWWGDWDDNGTPNDLSDDQIKPIPLWRIRYMTGNKPYGAAADDGKVNTLEEINEYIQLLKNDDQHGNQVAARPVLVKGGRVWYEDGNTVGSFDYAEEDVHTESSHPFSVSHNVRPGNEAWGSGGCTDCHGGHSTPFFDRKILVDPWTPDGTPKYRTVRGLLKLSPR